MIKSLLCYCLITALVQSLNLFGFTQQPQTPLIDNHDDNLHMNKFLLQHPELNELYNEYLQQSSNDDAIDIQTSKQRTLRDITDDEWEYVDSSNYQMRIKEPNFPDDLKIDNVKQYTGYLDIKDEDKHLFFWFFESRNDPINDPILLWLTGGPGGSSMIGLFFEMGPASINAQLKPVSNEYAWNSNASVIFLDEPVNVGFSHGSNIVYNSASAAIDVYEFLTLFFDKFPQYQQNDFHLTGESYLGHYLPAIGHEILKHPDRNFNFKSVLIGNGITDSKVQLKSYGPMACGKGGVESVLSAKQCDDIDELTPKAVLLIDMCYKHPNPLICDLADWVTNKLMAPYSATGLNRYDMRSNCENELFCYDNMYYLQNFLNLPQVLSLIGSDIVNYTMGSALVSNSFRMYGDLSMPFQQYIAELLTLQIPVLIYVGDQDYICNWLGNHEWTELLEWDGHEGFNNETLKDYDVDDVVVGKVKSFKNFTFLRVFQSGHMVPYDQPYVALEMLNSWINGDYTFGY